MGLVLFLPGSSDYRVWESGMSDLTESNIKHGLNKAKDFLGFFTLPVFRDLCKTTAADIGLPEKEVAYAEACNATDVLRFKWSHPAVYHAGHDVGFYDLRMGGKQREFYAAYFTRCQQAVAGTLHGVPTNELLTESISVRLTPEQRKSRMASLREATGV